MKNTLRALSLVLASTLSATATATAATAPQPAPLADRLDATIQQAIAQKRIVGTVVIVARNGRIVYRRAAGFADRETGKPMKVDAIFRFASMSKPLVTAAAMRLVEDGVLRLNDPVSKWLPAFRPTLPDGTVPVITVKQLLTHTAGLGYGFFESENGPYHRARISDGMDMPGLSLEENLRRLASVPLFNAPGQEWRYSLSIDVLGGVLSAATGKPLEQIVREKVTAPLRMRDTAFSVADRRRLTAAYQDGQPVPVKISAKTPVPLGGTAVHFDPERLFDRTSYASGGAGMNGTAGDFMKFLLSLRSGTAGILKPATKSQMMEDQVGVQAQTQGPGWGFGYGWAVLDNPLSARTPQAKGTIQWGGAYGHNWFYDPVNDVAVIALTNTAFEGMSGAFPAQIRDAVYGGATH